MKFVPTKRGGRISPGSLVLVSVGITSYCGHMVDQTKYGIVLSNWGRTPGTDIWTYLVRTDSGLIDPYHIGGDRAYRRKMILQVLNEAPE